MSTWVRLGVIGTLVVACAAWASAASADVVVGYLGDITVNTHDLALGRSTVNDVRQAEGRAPNSDLGVMGRKGPVGRSLEYRVPEGRRTCTHVYLFATGGGNRLSDFESTCRATRTKRGGRVGMTARQAEAAEKGALFKYSPAFGHDCSFEAAAIAIPSSGGIWLVVWADTIATKNADRARVSMIGVYADNAVTWKAACE